MCVYMYFEWCNKRLGFTDPSRKAFYLILKIVIYSYQAMVSGESKLFSYVLPKCCCPPPNY